MDINIKEKTACLLDNYTNVAITGKDAQKFLQGQLSCDLNDITSSQPGIGCYCNIKGRIVAYFDIFNIDSSYIINLPTSVAEKFVNSLKKYAIFSKVEITIENNLKTIGVFGVDNNFASSINENIAHIHNLCQPQDCYKVITTNENYSKLINILDGLGINKLCGEDKWQHFLIMNKTAEILAEQSEKYLPAELNLDRTSAISFSKGCFMGQEVIARMKYIGKMKKSLILLNILSRDNLSIKNKLTADDKLIGEIINLVKTKDGIYLALSLIINDIIDNSKKIKLENFDDAEVSFE